MHKGYYISCQPPYGYKVNPNDPNQLVIDGEDVDWNTIIRKYWKSKGYNSAPIGSDGYKIELNHPYGQHGTKKYIFEEMTHIEHVQFHRIYETGRGNGSFNRYYKFDNIWEWLRSVF